MHIVFYQNSLKEQNKLFDNNMLAMSTLFKKFNIYYSFLIIILRNFFLLLIQAIILQLIYIHNLFKVLLPKQLASNCNFFFFGFISSIECDN